LYRMCRETLFKRFYQTTRQTFLQAPLLEIKVLTLAPSKHRKLHSLFVLLRLLFCYSFFVGNNDSSKLTMISTISLPVTIH
jgi:hypothetical protein